MAREALPVLGVLFAVGVLGFAIENPPLMYWSALLFSLAALLARQPLCNLSTAPLAVASPAHGLVLAAGNGHDPWLARPAVHVRIAMRPWDVHVLRSPIEGRIRERRFSGERRLWAERKHAVWLRSDEGDDVVLALNLGLLAPLVRLRLQPGGRIGHGQLCGFCYFAAVVDVYLPSGSVALPAPGTRIAAGSGIVAELVHKAESTRPTEAGN